MGDFNETTTRPTPDRSEARERIAGTLSSCRDYLQDIVGGATISDRSIVNAIALVDEIDAILATGLVQDEAKIRADEREKCAKVAEQFGEPYAVNTNTGAMMFRANVAKIAAAIRNPAGRNAT